MHDIDFIVKVIERMIDKDKTRLQDFVKAKRWSAAAELETYIAGMEQALAVVKLGMN